MAQHALELILLKLVAGYLATPIFLVDPEGELLYYNEPAEALLGLRYDETGPMPIEEWSTRWTSIDDAGDPLPPERLPLVRTITERRPAHDTFWIRGLDGGRRRITAMTFPLDGLGGQQLGAVAVFWEDSG
jgi:PAS domain-containing protein